ADLLTLLCSFAMLFVYMSYKLTGLHPQTNPQDTASAPLGASLRHLRPRPFIKKVERVLEKRFVTELWYRSPMTLA
ncbi:hypothetical protein MRX96_051718, partial [Rhipicephalus microplus]